MKTVLLAILLAVYIFTILCVIFLERKTPTEAVLWVLVLVCLPYVGLLLYLVFGSTLHIKLTAYIRKKRLRKRDPASAGDESAETIPNDIRRQVRSMLSEEDTQVAHFNAAYNESRLTSYRDMEIFTDGESHYRRLFRDIREAESCIFIEFYTIQNDIVGQELARVLTEKAREGVSILVMCDFMANVSTPAKMFRPLKEAGGKVVRVKPFLTHYRSHRKIVVIDHKVAYIGGMNIGRQYANLGKHKNPWRDTQVRLTGPCCATLDRYFMTDWMCSTHRRTWNETAPLMEDMPEETHELSRNLCQFIMGGVDTCKESVKMCYLSMIRSAKKSIRIQSPYFIPDASILDALKAAAASGVQVELMIPGIKASFFLDPVTTYYCGELLEYGARIYKYHGYIHAKTMVVDGELCCIGSVNMDMRSLEVDDEICGVFYENAVVSRYSALYDEDITHCDPYTYETFRKRGAWERFGESFFLLFAPLM